MKTNKQNAFYPLLGMIIFLFAQSSATRVSLVGTDWTVTNQSITATATVPGTVHTALLAAKIIDEPYWSFDDLTLRSLVYQSWTYTKKFSLQQDFRQMTQFQLHFDQVDTVSNVTLNQCYLGNTTSMFFAYIFKVPNNCLQQDNVLKVEFMSPVLYALQQAIAYNTSVHPDCPGSAQHGECHVQFVRKEPCSFSWDWGPAFAPIGITGDVYLEGINNTVTPLRLDSVNIVTLASTTQTWQVDVQISGGDSTTMYTFDFQLSNTSWSYTKSVTFNQNTTITLSIPNQQVKLWWPNGHGDQPLYKLGVSSSSNQFMDSRLIGFRTVELIQHNYTNGITGLSFYFQINSQPIFVKGSNWIPSDAFQERVSDEKLERLLTSAKLAGMNMLRIWGGGIYERDSFYEIADRLGIMLWHDFMFACSLYPVDEAFLSNVHKEIIYQVQRLQSHPCIALWAGNNENEGILAGFIRPLPPAEQERLKSDYRKLYIGTVMTALLEVDPTGSRPFVGSSPSNGIESAQENYTAQNPQDPLFGDVHFYNYNMDTWNGENYPITRFLSETGVESMPSPQTWQEATNASEDLRYESNLVENRQHHGDGQHQMLLQIENNLALPMTKDPLKNFTQMIYLTQINQAMTLKSVSDHCRYYSPVEMIDPKTSKGNTMGLMYWQLNDIWQAPTWASIEYGLQWKMAHYYVRHAYAPVYVLMRSTPYLPSVTDDNATISVYLVNDLASTTRNQVNCSINSFDSFENRLSMQYNLGTSSPGVQLINSTSYKLIMEQTRCLNGSQCLMRCSLNSDTQTINEVQTLFFVRPRDMQLSNPNLRIASVEQRSLTEMTITINADKPALFVWLDLPSGMSGYYSQNGFHMFQSQITITFTSWTSLIDFNSANIDLRVTSLYDVSQP